MNTTQILLLTSAMLVISCSSSTPVPVVYNTPRIELPPDPIPATNKITDNSTSAEVMKSWVSTAADFRGWNIVVRKLIENSR